MKETDLDAKLSKLMGLSDQIDEAEAHVKRLNDEYDKLNYEITEYFQNTDMQSKKIYGKNFYLSSRTFCKIEDPVAFDTWVETNDAYKLVMARNAKKLDAYVEECASSGQPIPDGVVPGFIKYQVKIGKG